MRGTSTLVPALALALGAAAVAAACHRANKAAPLPTPQQGAASAEPVGFNAVRDGGPDDAPYEGPVIAALFAETPIMSEMDWPSTSSHSRHPGDKANKSTRLGYIRQGGKVPVIPEAHPNDACSEGWYELVAGGFVCARYATLDLNHPRVKLAPHPPYLDQALPYQYGYNLTNGAPLYRQAPSYADRLKYEPWLQPKRTDVSSPDDPVTVALNASGGPPVGAVNPNDPLGAVDPWDSGVLWYLRTYDGGKRTDITLDDLRGDDGVLIRRMVKGFYLALDREVDTGPHRGTRWWRTTSGQLAPFDRVFVAKPATDFHGVWLGHDPPPE